jgi:glycosyltransferase involved in cell wall biosynthesis
MTTCTVAIPVYNRRELVQRTLESALAQDAPGLDILVVDNCSDDGTWEALQRYRDPRLRLVRNERNLGLFGNFNRCLALACGAYLRFLCSDDTLTPGTLRRELALMERYPAASLLSTRGRLVDETLSPLGIQADLLGPGVYPGDEATYAALWCQLSYGKNIINYPSGVLLRRSAVELAGGFDEQLRLVGDLDFFFRVLAHGDLIVLDAVGCEVMLHSGQEGITKARSGLLVREFELLLRRTRGATVGDRRAEALRRQLPGYALWLALKFLSLRMLPEARLHLALAHSAGSMAPLRALARMAGLRALLSLTRLRFVPLSPRRADRVPT